VVRSSFIVVAKNGARYGANHLSLSWKTGESGMRSYLSFISSGVMVELAAEDVERVEFSPAGASYCSECDGGLAHFVGAGIHADPKP